MIQGNLEDHRVTVVLPSIPNLNKFFNYLNDNCFSRKLNIVYFSVFRSRLVSARNVVERIIFLLSDIVQERRYLNKIYDEHFASTRQSKIYFFSRFMNPHTFYFLNKMKSLNDLVFMPDQYYDNVSIKPISKTNLMALLSLIRNTAIYGSGIALGEHPLLPPSTYISDDFFRRNVTRIISADEREKLMTGFELSQFCANSDKPYSVIYFHQDFFGNEYTHDYYADRSAFEDVLNNVFKVIGEYFPLDKVAVKYHPATKGERMKLPFGDVLPDFIPAEFYFNSETTVYVSVASLALANVKSGIAVSLIDMMEFSDPGVRNELKQMLLDWSRSKILFPQTLIEFEKMLCETKKRAGI